MKNCLKIAILIVAIIFPLTGCQVGKSSPPVGQDKKSEEKKVILAKSVDPSKEGSWTKLSEFTIDLDGDEKEETIGLYTSAERDAKGEIMWDDGQNWLLLVEDDNFYYPLFSRYVQLGSVYFTIAYHGEEKEPTVTVLVSTGGGLTLTNYLYDSKSQGYLEKLDYDSGPINSMFTSFPGYL